MATGPRRRSPPRRREDSRDREDSKRRRTERPVGERRLWVGGLPHWYEKEDLMKLKGASPELREGQWKPGHVVVSFHQVRYFLRSLSC